MLAGIVADRAHGRSIPAVQLLAAPIRMSWPRTLLAALVSSRVGARNRAIGVHALFEPSLRAYVAGAGDLRDPATAIEPLTRPQLPLFFAYQVCGRSQRIVQPGLDRVRPVLLAAVAESSAGRRIPLLRRRGAIGCAGSAGGAGPDGGGRAGRIGYGPASSPQIC